MEQNTNPTRSSFFDLKTKKSFVQAVGWFFLSLLVVWLGNALILALVASDREATNWALLWMMIYYVAICLGILALKKRLSPLNLFLTLLPILTLVMFGYVFSFGSFLFAYFTTLTPKSGDGVA